MRGSILIVDDNRGDRLLLARPLRHAGYDVRLAESGAAALELYAQQRADVCLVDHAMPGMDGLDFLDELRRRDPTAQVIMVTGFGSIDRAVEAMRRGAIDFLTKPVEDAVLLTRLERARVIDAVLAENRNLLAEVSGKFDFSQLVAVSPPMRQVLALAEQAARHDVTVLITGESGVGKEVVARAIHYNSARHGGRFFAMNCAAIPENLIESELFGHEKGAFTGAERRKEGLIEQASKGTLLLDEIGDMPLTAQAKLLRVIDAREMFRVGGTQPVAVDARLIAATNVDLEARVAARQFRDDLYFRLNVFAIHIPPLRERAEDILPLAHHILERLAHEMGREPPPLAPDAVTYLSSAAWPGNVRELANAVERAMIVCQGDAITAQDFPPRRGAPPTAPPVAGRSAEELKRAADALERQSLLDALEKANRNVSRAARLLGIGRAALRYRLRKHSISSEGLE
jgi:DNA-binding NtrC family response regulator